MAVAAHALITLADARAFIGFDADDTSRNTALERCIDDVSAMVQRTVGREIRPLTPSAEPATRTVACRRGSARIDLQPLQARRIDAVSIGDIALGPDEYQPGPIASPYGVYDYIELAHAFHSSSPFRSVAATVTGLFGWPTIPDDIKGWVLDLVKDRWRAHHAYYADAEGLVEPDDSGPLTIPYRLRDNLERLRLLRIGSV